MAGMACARRLVTAGRRVVLFDKGRAPGGRVCTRRHGEHRWDHGAPYFDRDAVTAPHSSSAPWAGRHTGIPTMSALAAALRRGLDVRCGRRVAPLRRREIRGWVLEDEGGQSLGSYPEIVLAIPPAQAAAMVDGIESAALQSVLTRTQMAPILTLMVAFARPVDGPALARPSDGPLQLIVNDGQKPGRGGLGWVAHSTTDFAREHLEDPPMHHRPVLMEAMERWLGPLPEVRFATVHRWRHGRVTRPVGLAAWFEPTRHLGACGDWCLGPNIEHAISSGTELAAQMLAR